MVDRRISPKNFDASLPLVSTRAQMVDGEAVTRGSLISDQLDVRLRMKMWLSGRAIYEKDYRPVPEAEGGDQQETHGVSLTESGSNGYYTIAVPWIDEPIKVRGKDKAQAEYARIIAEGPPEGWTGAPQDGQGAGSGEGAGAGGAADAGAGAGSGEGDGSATEGGQAGGEGAPGDTGQGEGGGDAAGAPQDGQEGGSSAPADAPAQGDPAVPAGGSEAPDGAKTEE